MPLYFILPTKGDNIRLTFNDRKDHIDTQIEHVITGINTLSASIWVAHDGDKNPELNASRNFSIDPKYPAKNRRMFWDETNNMWAVIWPTIQENASW